jgi:hypothetical protein
MRQVAIGAVARHPARATGPWLQQQPRMRLALTLGMRILAKVLPLLLAWICLPLAARGQQSASNTQLTGLLPEVAFSSLSQRDPNPLGEKALAMHPEQWKHAETEHFIYHFVSNYIATPASSEAEVLYQVIAQELKRERPAGDTKSHIYFFESPADWQQFQSVGHLEKWSGGIHSQGSLFLQRSPNYKFSGTTLGHEIAHLVLHRYYPDGIPSWLDEGFAQYVSKCAHATYKRTRGFDARPRSQAIAPGDLIPVASLVAMTQPPSDRVDTFYDESERLVRFLVSTDKIAFLGFLDALARHQPFDSTLLQFYGVKFSSAATFEEKFRDYAVKDFGTSIQDGQ